MHRALASFALILAACGGGAVTVDASGADGSVLGVDAEPGPDTGVADASLDASAAAIGEHCLPEAVPSGGFSEREVYVETGSRACASSACIVFHLDGNPLCTPECTGCGGTETCERCTPDEDGAYPCVVAGMPERPDSAERTFCTCRCSEEGSASLPLCTCDAGMHCVPDAEPGGGYCVSDAL